MFHGPLDVFCVLDFFGEVVDDCEFRFVVFGRCIWAGDKHMVAQFLVSPFWWSERSVSVVFLVVVVSGVVMASGALTLASGGVLVGSVCLSAPGAVDVAVVAHFSCVRSSWTCVLACLFGIVVLQNKVSE